MSLQTLVTTGKRYFDTSYSPINKRLATSLIYTQANLSYFVPVLALQLTRKVALTSPGMLAKACCQNSDDRLAARQEGVVQGMLATHRFIYPRDSDIIPYISCSDPPPPSGSIFVGWVSMNTVSCSSDGDAKVSFTTRSHAPPPSFCRIFFTMTLIARTEIAQRGVEPGNEASTLHCFNSYNYAATYRPGFTRQN